MYIYIYIHIYIYIYIYGGLNDLPVSLDHLCVSATPAVQDDRLREAPRAQGPGRGARSG